MGPSQYKQMDTFKRFYTRGSAFKFDTIFNTAPITEAQKCHMTKVYNTLAYTGFVTFITIAVNGPWNHIHPILASLLLILSLVYIVFTKYRKEELNLKRMGALTAFPMCIGIIHRNFVRHLFTVNPDIVNTALMASVGIFVSFSLAAMYITNRVRMFITSAVTSLAVYLTLASFANLFVESELTYGVILSLGIVVFVGYIVLDTQRILHDFSNGDDDYVMHAILLYYDLFELFFRILITLKDKDDKKQSKSQKSKDD